MTPNEKLARETAEKIRLGASHCVTGTWQRAESFEEYSEAIVLAALTAATEQHRADSERLDWLEAAGNVALMHTIGTPENPPPGRCLRIGLGQRVKYHEGSSYRAAIDAAMSKEATS